MNCLTQKWKNPGEKNPELLELPQMLVYVYYPSFKIPAIIFLTRIV